MVWIFAAAGAFGLLLGVRFRLPAVLAASSAVLAGGIAAPLAGAPMWTALTAAFGALCALQGGYVVGLALWCAFSRVSWPARSVGRDSAADDRMRVPATGSPAAGNN